MICAEVADGKSMRTIVKSDTMPAMSTVFKWLREITAFSEQYAKAKQEAADAMAEDILEITDTPMLGEIVTVKADGSREVRKEDMLGHRRLQVDSRKWIMSKLLPKKYGDKVDVTTGGDKLGFDVSAAQAAQLVRERENRSDTP